MSSIALSGLALALLQDISDSPSSSVAPQAMLALIPIFMIIGIVAVVIILIPFWFICKKAGFSPWLSLLNFIPLGNLVLLYILAFAEWKTVPKAPAVPPAGPPPIV